ncbi:hypothetical protein BDZ45DRAFT_693271 [Acephala macrosclerotiorum]|nr:hypothetical protein BDZ45DRAFT_693271 [Acephala macrosclerotiorum]
MASEKRGRGESTSRKSQTSSGKSKASQKKGDSRPTFSAPRDVVTFYVTGNGEEQKFVIHREYACHYSPVLKAAFNSNFIEGRTGEYKLDDTTHGAFSLLTHWIYHQKLDLKHLDPEFDQTLNDNIAILSSEELNLFNLWIPADKLCIAQLQNYVVDCIKETGNSCVRLFSCSALTYVYEKTGSDSRLRKLLVILLAACLLPTVAQRNTVHYPTKLMIELMVFMMKRAGDTVDVDQLSAVKNECYVPVQDE